MTVSDPHPTAPASARSARRPAGQGGRPGRRRWPAREPHATAGRRAKHSRRLADDPPSSAVTGLVLNGAGWPQCRPPVRGPDPRSRRGCVADAADGGYIGAGDESLDAEPEEHRVAGIDRRARRGRRTRRRGSAWRSSRSRTAAAGPRRRRRRNRSPRPAHQGANPVGSEDPVNMNPPPKHRHGRRADGKPP